MDTVAHTGLQSSSTKKENSVFTVISASMVGTMIEYFDFYAYGTAAAVYFPKVFFPELTPAIASILSLLTFGVAFLARPFGSFVFGHFGDKKGRKSTLVASLLFMGVSTVLIGFLPSYHSIGLLAVALLCTFRFFQGVGLGGNWSGAALVATENAPKNRRALYGSFPALGAPLGFVLCNGLFLIMDAKLSPEQMTSFGWRIPFWTSAVLVLVGFWMRHRLNETPLFENVKEEKQVEKAPLVELFKHNTLQFLQGTFMVGVAFTLFFTLGTWSLSYATTALGFANQEYLVYLLFSMLFFAAGIVGSCLLADKYGRKVVLLVDSALILAFAAVFPFMLSGHHNVAGAVLFLFLGFLLIGGTFGPSGAALPELFPTKVRYSGSGLSFNVASVIGAAFVPSVTAWVVLHWGIHYVGIYMAVMAFAAVVSLATVKETKDKAYDR